MIQHRPKIGVDLYILHQMRYAGIACTARALLPELIHAMPEAEWCLFVHPEDSSIGQFEKFPNVAVRRMAMLRWSPELWKIAGLSFAARRNKLDLLFLPTTRIPLVRIPCPTVVCLHDVGFLQMPEYLAKGTIRKTHIAHQQVAKHATAISSNSDFTKQEFVRHYHVDPARVFIASPGVDRILPLPPNVDESWWQSRLERYGIKRPYVVYLGTIQERKNLLTLIAAAEQWRKTIPQLQLVLAGALGWTADRIKTEAAKYPMQQVCLPGAIPDTDLSLILGGSLAFVLPSWYEGFGVPVIQAMASGTIAVLSNRSALPEVGGDAALYFDPASAHQLAEQILRIWSDSTLRQSLVERGRHRAQAFTWQECARRTVVEFRHCLSNRPAEMPAEHN